MEPGGHSMGSKPVPVPLAPAPPPNIVWSLVTATHFRGDRYMVNFELAEEVAQVSIMAPCILLFSAI